MPVAPLTQPAALAISTAPKARASCLDPAPRRTTSLPPKVVVASEITCLRINERENNIVFCLRIRSTVAGVDFFTLHPTRAFPGILLEGSPNEAPAARTKRRGLFDMAVEHDVLKPKKSPHSINDR
jgi:hypothetical protein